MGWNQWQYVLAPRSTALFNLVRFDLGDKREVIS